MDFDWTKASDGLVEMLRDWRVHSRLGSSAEEREFYTEKIERLYEELKRDKYDICVYRRTDGEYFYSLGVRNGI